MGTDAQSARVALDLLILTVLERRGPSHGYDLANVLHDWSAEAIQVEEGSLYPALHRMEETGWVSATWTVTERKRRARIYRITRAGTAHLTAERERWDAFAGGVARVLRHV
jgi:PadR family transcriptional regulator, regulatory protein PadR